ncbi:uncharacterized protein LOC127767632 isoform X3 [Oryza glaberrima]|uniref:uncharacterized protein LOC127767632 isoform X3 n=1 Tax=Oryza glaberrima TaxID=4538 RepID=UPI00224C35C3|nr:uncharacterized protein LOC127767632 isoform X3 [Oryza glaberrima]
MCTGSHEDVSHLSVAELKRNRARDRYAALTPEQKDDRNKKARERRKRKKEETQVSAPLGDISNISAVDIMKCQLEVTDSSPLHQGTSHLNITPRRLPFTIISNVAHYGPNEVPMSRFTQSTLNMNTSDFVVDNSGCENQYESSFFEGSDQNECDHDDDISLDNELVRAPTNETKERLQSKLARAREKYATLTPEQKQAKVDQRRTQHQSLTKEQRLELNARRRVARQSMPDVEIHDMNARRRSRRQNVTPGERSAHLARRNALYAARRDKPCAESIALECPEGSIPLLLNPTPCLETTGDVPSTSSLQTEHAADHQARSCTFNDDDMDSFMDDDSDMNTTCLLG